MSWCTSRIWLSLLIYYTFLLQILENWALTIHTEQMKCSLLAGMMMNVVKKKCTDCINTHYALELEHWHCNASQFPPL